MSSKRKFRVKPRRHHRCICWWKTRGRCFYCKRRLVFWGGYKCQSDSNMVLDHFIPLSKGGVDDLSNLVPSCQLCDKLKRNFLPTSRVVSYLAAYLATFKKFVNSYPNAQLGSHGTCLQQADNPGPKGSSEIHER